MKYFIRRFLFVFVIIILGLSGCTAADYARSNRANVLRQLRRGNHVIVKRVRPAYLALGQDCLTLERNGNHIAPNELTYSDALKALRLLKRMRPTCLRRRNAGSFKRLSALVAIQLFMKSTIPKRPRTFCMAYKHAILNIPCADRNPNHFTWRVFMLIALDAARRGMRCPGMTDPLKCKRK